MDLQSSYENEWSKRIVMAEADPVKIFETNDKIVQKFEPVFMKASSNYRSA